MFLHFFFQRVMHTLCLMGSRQVKCYNFLMWITQLCASLTSVVFHFESFPGGQSSNQPNWFDENGNEGGMFRYLNEETDSAVFIPPLCRVVATRAGNHAGGSASGESCSSGLLSRSASDLLIHRWTLLLFYYTWESFSTEIRWWNTPTHTPKILKTWFNCTRKILRSRKFSKIKVQI